MNALTHVRQLSGPLRSSIQRSHQRPSPDSGSSVRRFRTYPKAQFEKPILLKCQGTSSKADIITRVFTKTLGADLNMRQKDDEKRDLYDAYSRLPQQDQQSVLNWLSGDASKAVVGFAKASTSESPFVFDPNRMYMKEGSMDDYNAFKQVFEKLPKTKHLMIREMSDPKLGLKHVAENLSYAARSLSSLWNSGQLPEKRSMTDYYPDGLLPKLEKSLSLSPKIMMPMSSCTINDEYQHAPGPKIQLVIFGDGWPIQHVAHMNKTVLDTDFTVQDEVVLEEGDLSVVMTMSFPNDTLCVLEKEPGSIAKALGKGHTIQESRECVLDYFDDVYHSPQKQKVSFRNLNSANGVTLCK